MPITDNASKYWDADYKAKPYPGEPAKPKVTTRIAGHVITVEYTIVNRKCYDGLSTPTRKIIMDGKRIALADLLKIIK